MKILSFFSSCRRFLNLSLFLVSFLFFFGIGIKPLFGKTNPKQLFSWGRSQLKSGQAAEASQSFFALSKDKKALRYRYATYYYLARSFYELGLYEVSSLYAYQVLRFKTRYRSPALKVLLKNFQKSYNESLTQHLIQAMERGSFKLNRRQRSDMYFLVGHRLLYLRRLDKAEKFLTRVDQGSSYFYYALYDRALLYVEKGQLSTAKQLFTQLLSLKQNSKVTDAMRVTALMSLGRIYYQTKEWERALHYYRQVPKDSSFWHASLFESTWVLLQSLRLRSVLSNLHSLQSDYYEYFYLPESFWLRSIVYLYICRYEEMEKVLQAYYQTYNPLLVRAKQVLSSSTLPSIFYNDILVVRDIKEEGENQSSNIKSLRVPYVLMKHLLSEPEVQGIVKQLDSISEQKKRWGRLPASWRNSAVGRSSWRVLKKSLSKNGQSLAFWVRSHLKRMVQELESLDVQMNLVRYEMINQKKIKYKKSLIESDKKAHQQIDSGISYGTYLQNGYDYWSFHGEYWLDEVGNYYYLGKGQCE